MIGSAALSAAVRSILAVAGALLGATAAPAACPWPASELGGVQNAQTRRLEIGLAARLRRHQVPGIGVAVIRDGTLAWARGWGVRDAATCAPVTAATAFQAASISKTVAALTAVRLADRGLLDLDRDVAGYLRRWAPPVPGITLRALLGHTAGMGVHGFPGYPRRARLPALPQILDGLPPANTPAVRREAAPGSYSYSGGGYEIAELALADALGQPYPALAQVEVLQPLNMRGSGFAAPATAASGHVGGRVVPGGFHLYPEAAAAGLWATPADLARLLLAIAGREPVFAVAALQMTAPVAAGYGLGLQISGEGAHRTFGHSGSNHGFRALALIFPATGNGVVVMTNGEQGDALVREIVDALAADWSPGSP